METTIAKAEELAASIKEYAEARMDEVKLETAEKTSAVMANLVAGAIVTLVFLFVAVFAGIALALLLGDWTGKPWLGFLLMAAFYLLLAFLTWTAKEKLIRMPFMNFMIHQLFTKEQHE